MRESVHELNRIPTEFHENGAPELPALPDEFNRYPAPQKDKSKDRRKRFWKMLILAVAGLMTIGVLTPDATVEAEAVPPIEAQQPSGQETETPVGTDAPKKTAAAEATPVPTPEPEPLPDSEVIYYQTFSVGHGIILLTDPAHTTAVHVRLYDEQIDAYASMYEHDLTPEEIAAGRYDIDYIELGYLRGEHAEAYDALGEDAYPKPYLQAVVSYRLDDGTEGTTERHSYYLPEDWVFYSFCGDEEQLYGPNYPRCFVLSVSEYRGDAPVFTADADRELEPGEIFVSVTIDGERIPAELCRQEHYEETYTFDDGDSYTSLTEYFVIPLPDGFPQRGTAEIKIRQRFRNYDYILENTYTLEYDVNN